MAKRTGDIELAGEITTPTGVVAGDAGEDLNLTAGSGHASSGDGGSINITPGVGNGIGDDGKTFITSIEAPLPINTQVGTSYTAVLSDAEKVITLDNAAAIAMTIPANASVAYPIGTKLNFEQLGAGAVTIGITSDTLSFNAGATAVMNDQYSIATALKITATSWVLFGQLVPASPPLTSVAISDLDDGVDGELITWDAEGVATTVAVGTATHVLTSNGVGTEPTFQVSPAGGIGTETAQDDILIGTDSGSNLVPAFSSQNILIGVSAGESITNGDDNVVIGHDAMSQTPTAATGVSNIAIGTRAMNSASITSANLNIGIGQQALDAITVGVDNIAIGADAGGALTGGLRNIMLGNQAGILIVNGNDNIAIGDNCGPDAFSSPGQNVFVGNTIGNTSIGDGNVAVGYEAFRDGGDADQNTCIGTSAGKAITGGDFHVAIGSNAMGSATGSMTSSNNVAIGRNSMSGTGLLAAGSNVAIGAETLTSLVGGDDNTVLGFDAGGNLTDGGTNTIIGSGAGTSLSTTSAGNVLLGYQAGPTVDAIYSNRLYINNSESDTPIIFGDFATGAVRLSGTIRLTERADHIGTPTATFGELWLRSSDNHLIFTDDSGVDNDLISGGGGISNVVEDTTPQLGGNLDVNGFDIVGAPAAGATSSGNPIDIIASDAGATSGDGGAVSITAGAASGSGDGGSITLTPGAGAGNGSAGAIIIPTTTAPTVTTNKLYNVAGALTWNGTDLTAGGGGGDEIVDADGDTRIQVEESADEDVIRMDVGPFNANFPAKQNALTLFSIGFTVELPDAIGASSGGPIVLSCGNGYGSGDGGDIDLNAGVAGPTGDGGDINLYTGYAESSIQRGGNMTLYATGCDAGTGGGIFMTSGYGGTAAGVISLISGDNNDAADGGQIIITAGSGGPNGGNGGDITLTAGTTTSGSTGSIVIPDQTAPSPTANKLYSLGGVLTWNGLTLATGSGGINNVLEDTTPQLGGDLDVNGNDIVGAPAAGATSAGGPIAIVAANGGATSGDGGAVTITGGDVNSASGDVGGDVNITAGSGSTADDDGNIVISTGAAGIIETIHGYIATNSTGASALIATIPLTSGDSTVYEVFAVARQDSGTESAAFRIFGAAENTGGTAALVGSSAKDRTDDGAASADWDVTMGVSGGNLTITLDNDAETVDWKIKVRLTEL